MRSKKTKCISFSAILSALSVALLYLGSVIEVLDLSTAALTSFLIVFAVIELGGAYPYLIWVCTSALSLLLLPNKLPALLYLFFAGIYPILKALFERHRPIFSWSLKMSSFFIMLFGAYLAARFVFLLPEVSASYDAVFVALATLAFVLYDIAMSKIILLYLVKLRKRFRIHKFFE